MRPVLALAVAVAAQAGAQPEVRDVLSVEEYAAFLDAIRGHVEEGRRVEARGAAFALLECHVRWGDETLAPDATVLSAVVEAGDADTARRAARRLRMLVSALGATRLPERSEAPRADLLARITPSDDVRAGGEVPRLRVEPLTLPERLKAALVAVGDAVASLLRWIREQLAALRPERPDARPTPGRTAVVAGALAFGVAVLLAVLVLRSRRGRPDPPELESAAVVAETADADPLSRHVSGWEQRAAELAAARRFREAIRAWYHAVLVALFQAGLAHHQKGRTNWEYVAGLDPQLRWRPAFAGLTRSFDREWYGRRSSDAAALAEYAREARDVLAAVRRPGAGR